MGYWNAYPEDSEGEAIPWYTYAAVEFLKDVVQTQWNVFEYGCGYSSIFWNKHCTKTVSVEHNEHWFDRLTEWYPQFDLRLVKEGDLASECAVELIKSFEARNFCLPLSPSRDHNVEHGLLNKDFAGYAAEVTSFPRKSFDVIVVDGMARSLCLYIAAEYVSDDGIIILDNSDRWQYNDLQHYLIDDKGFKRVDFQGLGPLNPHGWTTSFFFRSAGFLLEAPARRPRGAGDLGW